MRVLLFTLGVGCASAFAPIYGDCKDKATYLHALLKTVGITSAPTVIYSHSGSPRPFDLPSLGVNCTPLRCERTADSLIGHSVTRDGNRWFVPTEFLFRSLEGHFEAPERESDIYWASSGVFEEEADIHRTGGHDASAGARGAGRAV
jgi:hypothetical protein